MYETGNICPGATGMRKKGIHRETTKKKLWSSSIQDEGRCIDLNVSKGR